MKAAAQKFVIRPGWDHVVLDDDHPADCHYAADGKWVCFTCRAPVHFTGITSIAPAQPPRDAPPGGLESDGS